jgi:hypothetical protein
MWIAFSRSGGVATPTPVFSNSLRDRALGWLSPKAEKGARSRESNSTTDHRDRASRHALHEVHDYAYGRAARIGDGRSLDERMSHGASASDDEPLMMERVSRGLPSPHTPARWAHTVLARSTNLFARGVAR